MSKMRVAAMLMSVALILSATSCKLNSKKSGQTTVKKDDPWYDSSRFELQFQVGDKEMIDSYEIQYINGKILVPYTCMNTETYVDTTKLNIYDEQGNCQKSLTLSCPDFPNIQMINGMILSEDGKTALFAVSGFRKEFEAFFITFDLETGKGYDAVPILDPDGENLGKTGGIIKFLPAGEFLTIVSIDGTLGTNEQTILNYKDNELVSLVDLRQLGGVRYIDDLSYDPKTGEVVFNVVSNNGDMYTCREDPKSGQLKEKTAWTKDMENQENVIDYQYTSQGDLLRVDSLGNIFKLDREKNTAEKVLDNNWYSPFFADFGTAYAYDVNVLSYTEDTIVIHSYGTSGIPTPGWATTDRITVLKKAQENPHAGKKIIEISAPLSGSFSEYMSRAICEFNNTDPEYQIRVWSKYNEGVKAGRGFKTLDPEQERLYTLVSEIHNSDCPDLVMNLQMKATMQEGTLEDMSGYLDLETQNMLFPNILENAKVDGHLYFIPVLIEVEGLVLNKEKAGTDAHGITFDVYSDYVENAASGMSLYDYPFSKYNNRNAFVLSCIDIKSALEGDPVNFDSEQFRAASQYAKEHFQENAYDSKSDPSAIEERHRAKPDGRYARMANYEDYLRACKKENASYVIVGTPSVNGTGARYRVPESISVPVKSDMKDGARKFVNYLMTGSFITEDVGVFQGICINKNLMQKQLSRHTEYANLKLQDAIDHLFLKSDLEDEGYKFVERSSEEYFFSMMENLSVYCLEDKVIEGIVCDELAPFFAGDRTIDDAIKYINDRVSKYINEMK